MNTKLLPVELTQKAIALALADVCNGPKIKRSSTPYAKAFFKHYFGYSNPKKNEIERMVRGKQNKPQAIELIDRFIESNGQLKWGIDEYFAFKAYPSLKQSRDSKLENHCNLKVQQSGNVNDKRTSFRDCRVESLVVELMGLTFKQLGQWVAETESFLNEYEQTRALNIWFDKHSSSTWGFNDLYQGVSPSKIAYDLSFGDF